MKNNSLELSESQVHEIRYHAEGLLDRLAREGAQQLLAMALEAEVEGYTVMPNSTSDKTARFKVEIGLRRV